MWERAGLTRNDPGDQRRDEREESADAGKRWMQARGGREGENMKIIRVAGGVGSGKSQVLSILKEEYNAHVILADEVAKRLMEPGQPVFCQVVEALGEQILGADGTIDRLRMAQIIFSDREALRRVDAITHPAVWEAIVAEARGSGAELVVVEAAVMGEEEPDIYDEKWFVWASRETRISRLMENRGYSREKSLSIMANQWPDERFKKYCGVVIDNDGSLEETGRQIAAQLLHKGQNET